MYLALFSSSPLYFSFFFLCIHVRILSPSSPSSALPSFSYLSSSSFSSFSVVNLPPSPTHEELRGFPSQLLSAFFLRLLPPRTKSWNSPSKKDADKTRPDTRLPNSRAGGLEL